jgi:hypothetical protein
MGFMLPRGRQSRLFLTKLFAQIPINPSHDAKGFARNRREEMFVRRVLRARGVGVRDPDGRKAKGVREDFVRK